MKVVAVYVGEIMHCPPALSLVQVLNDLGIDTVLLTIGDDKTELQKSIGYLDSLQIKFVGKSYQSNIGLVGKFSRMLKIKKQLWKNINREYNEETVIWVVSEGSLKHLGNRLIGKKYILHFLELNEGIYYISGNPLLKLNYKELARKASVVVEAEYNRSHITKAWWELAKLPMIFPNKPYNTIKIGRNAEITSNEYVKKTMDNLAGKKVILYQGNISKERPLQEYIKAVGELGNDYAFVMMINGDNPYPDLHYGNFYCLSFIKPPFHLEVTSRAYIGILSYTPVKNDYSILNTLYCAPNKIWEYAKFGIPMIGNDLPALHDMFVRNKNGICVEHLEKDEIKTAIETIEKDYSLYSESSLAFFDSVDLKQRVQEILESTGILVDDDRK